MINYLIIIAITFAVCFIYANYLTKQKNSSQPIYDEGPKWHLAKQGTPTKGGKIFIIPTLVAILVLFFISKSFNLLILFIILLATFLSGLMDDNGKIKGSDNHAGLSAKQKLLIQLVIAIILDMWFFKTHPELNAITILALIALPLVFMGMTNATNLTDGLDGLLASVSIFAFIPLFLIASQINPGYSLILLVFLIGLFVFLMVNKNPAKIFMGDTGSLSIGALFIFSCVYLNLNWLGILLGSIYIVEMFSVIIQVTYFRYTKKKYGEGKRILLMAPLHHHLEKLGWSENKIDLVFSLIQIVISTIVFILYFMLYA